MIRFSATSVPRLPRLAWFVRLEKGTGTARLFHGPWVETRAEGFVEGGWAAPFDVWDFDRRFMTGTGALLRDGSLLFVTPNHTLDRICTLDTARTAWFSNSLPLLLAAADEQLTDDFLFYDSYIASIRSGLRRYERAIPTRGAAAVCLHYCTNIVVDREGAFRLEPKAPSPAFPDYGAYRRCLEQTVSAVAANASDRSRSTRYAPLATISRGYDSPAAAVLASSAGCSRAVTFSQSRRGSAGEDSGTKLAGPLGLSVKEFGRLDYREHGDFREIRNSGGPSEFLSFGDYLRGALLFTGFHGDMVWGTSRHSVSRDLVRSDSSGSSLTEYRLETGFVHLPVPFIAADSHPSIHAISVSAEMAPWSIGGSYDRPIPRRIVEEAGIPRELFGHRKRAAGVVVTTEGLEQTMSEASLADFRRFTAARWNVRSAVLTGMLRGVRKLVSFNERLARVWRRALRSFGIANARLPIVVHGRLRMLTFGYLGRESLLFHWGVGRLVDDYRERLSGQRPI